MGMKANNSEQAGGGQRLWRGPCVVTIRALIGSRVEMYDGSDEVIGF
jgi:hypothetical protein